MDELLAIQDDVTELQETYALVAAKKKAGSPTDPDLYIRSGRTRQRIWKRAARIDSEEAWDLAGKLIDATGEVYGASTVHEIDSAMTVIANTGAEIQRLVGKLLGGTAKQLDRGVELPD